MAIFSHGRFGRVVNIGSFC